MRVCRRQHRVEQRRTVPRKKCDMRQAAFLRRSVRIERAARRRDLVHHAEFALFDPGKKAALHALESMDQ